MNRVIQGDTRSLDNSSCGEGPWPSSGFFRV